jgi:phage-related minor tail protein
VARQQDVTAAMDMLIAAEEKGLITKARQIELVEMLNKKFDETPVKITATTAALGDLQKAERNAAVEAERMDQRIGSTFSQMMQDIDSAGDALGRFAMQLADTVMSNAFASISGSLGLGALFGPVASAKGNVFSGGALVPFAKGGVVSSPTQFPIRGGRTGVMGEAGTEGILPLTRGQDGTLGVHAYGGGGAGPSQIAVTVVGARGNQEVEAMVKRGVQAGLEQYDRSILPSSVAAINRDPRRRG